MNKITRYIALLLVALAVWLTACKNNDNVFPKVLYTQVNLVNASTDTLNFYLNGTRQNNTSNLFPAGFTNYLTVPSGQQNYQFKKAGAFTVLFSVPLNLADSSYNTLYIYGAAANETFTSKDTLLTYTNFPDTTQIRFVNVSPNAGSLNITIGDSIKFNQLAFKGVTPFALTGGGQKEVKVFAQGASAPQIDTTIEFLQGVVYTIFSKGAPGGKGNAAFDLGVLNNTQ